MIYNPITQTLTYSQDQYLSDIKSSLSRDAKTFEVLKSIANSIIKMISWEVDLPEKYPDNMIPVLDLRVGLDRENPQAPIKHYYYQKPMASKLVLTGTSSLHANQGQKVDLD